MTAKRPAPDSVAKPSAADRQRGPLVRASLAVSIDGYIADPRGGVEWLNPYFSPELEFDTFMASIGATIMGRQTFDVAQTLGGGGSLGGGISVVLTHRPLEDPPGGVEAYRGNLFALVERLRGDLADSGQDIWLMGGGVTIDQFRAAGLLDRLELGIMPVLLGEGIPLFPPHSRGLESFRQVRCRALSNGIVEAWYEPASE